jgi:hypothetical protein
MTARHLPPRRRIADVEPADKCLVPTDYVAAVYGPEAAEVYVEIIGVEHEATRVRVLERARKIGRLADGAAAEEMGGQETSAGET